MIRQKNNGKPTEPTDYCTQLLLEAQKGDSQAFGELYAELGPVARDFIASFNGQLCPYEREDLVHDTFLAIWEKRASYRGEASAKTFILAIAKNLMLRHIDRRQKIPMVNTDYINGVQSEWELCEPPDSLLPEPSETEARIQRAMAKLTDVQRQAIELKLSHASGIAAAKKAGCTPSQLAVRIYKGRKRLRQILNGMSRCILL